MMTRHQFVTFFFLALLVFVLVQTVRLFAPFFDSIFWAGILAYAFYPIYDRLRKPLKLAETFTALCMTLVIILIVMPPLAFLIVNLTGQAIDLYQLVTSYIREGGLERLIENIRSLTFIQRIEADFFKWEPLKENATSWLLNASKNIANFTITQAGTITRNIFTLALSALFTCFFIFIFLRDGNKIYRFIYQIAPLEEESKKSIFSQINGTFSAVIRGQLLTSLVQSIVSGIIYWILGLPTPIFLAAATFIATLIPFIGAAGIWIPLTIYLLTVQSFIKAGILFLFGILVISIIDNVMKPALIGEKTKLPYFLLFFGILGGLQVYGILGVFLGPLILSLFFVLVKIYQEKFA